MVSHFNDVHVQHVRRVQQNMLYIIQATEFSSDVCLELRHRMHTHDASKLARPECIPYVWRIWRTRCRAEGMQEPWSTLYADESLDQAIRDAVVHHVTHSRHHPEWHLDPDDMTPVDIIEMCCDWFAMSQEHHTSIDDWIAYVVPRRYAFHRRIPDIISTVNILKQQER